jgi:putative PIN family toxin of toxin-antitoxin system
VRIVLDTNVLMSGIFFGGVPGRILEAWSAGDLELLLSPEILQEYQRVGADLALRYPERASALAPVLALISMNAVLVEARPLRKQVSADASDDVFLAAARSGSAQVVVSGDRHLLDVSGWEGVIVMTPRQFSNRHLDQ